MTSILLYNTDNKILEFVKEDDVLNNLYFLKSKFPTKENITDYLKHGTDKEILKYLKDKDPENILKEIKGKISRIDYSIPLYDVFTKNLYLINKDNVYRRIVYDYYRFPDKSLVKQLQQKKEKLKKKIKPDNKREKEEKN